MKTYQTAQYNAILNFVTTTIYLLFLSYSLYYFYTTVYYLSSIQLSNRT